MSDLPTDKCFIIQPFDGAAFDKRYEDVIAPAVRDAGLVPYRVDRDPGALIPIDEIESSIRSSRVCIAEISTNNPNVWYELGFALAAGKDVVLLAVKEMRERFPFDIQHRSVITYMLESVRDFTDLRSKITTRLQTMLKRQAELKSVVVASPLAADPSAEGLSAHEMAALIVIGTETFDDSMSYYSLKNAMGNAGFTPTATSVAARSLIKKKLVVYKQEQDERGELYPTLTLSGSGEEWMIRNQDKLALRTDTNTRTRRSSEGKSGEDDELPF